MNDWGSEFNAEKGNILLLYFFCFYVVKHVIPLLSILCSFHDKIKLYILKQNLHQT